MKHVLCNVWYRICIIKQAIFEKFGAFQTRSYILDQLLMRWHPKIGVRINLLVHTVVPWKFGPPVSPTIRVRTYVVSGYLGCVHSKNSGNNQHHQQGSEPSLRLKIKNVVTQWLTSPVVPRLVGRSVIRTPRQSGHGFSGTQPRESNEKNRRKGSKMKFRTYFLMTRRAHRRVRTRYHTF